MVFDNVVVADTALTGERRIEQRATLFYGPVYDRVLTISEPSSQNRTRSGEIDPRAPGVQQIQDRKPEEEDSDRRQCYPLGLGVEHEGRERLADREEDEEERQDRKIECQA